MTQPQMGVGLTDTQGTATAPQFDPSTWQIPTGIRGVVYHVRRSFPGVTQKKHKDYLLYLDYVANRDSAYEDWQYECEETRKELIAQNIAAERSHKEEMVRHMMNLGVLPTVYFANWKSGSKTTLAAYVGTIMGKLSGRNSLLLPATANSKTGASGEITGLSGGGLTLSELARDLDSFRTPRDLAIRLATTRSGLGVVIEDSEGDINDERFTPDRFHPVMVLSFDFTYGCLLLDGGNDDVNVKEIPVMAARACDVIVFVASNTQPMSHIKMRQTIEMLKKDPYTGLVEDGERRLPGEFRSTADKIQHSLVTINGVKPDDEPYDFDQLRLQPEHGIEERASVEWQGEGYTVPWDQYVFGGHNRVTETDLSKIDQATYDAYLDVTLSILHEGARALGISLDRLPKFTPQEFVAPPEPVIPQPDYASNRSA